MRRSLSVIEANTELEALQHAVMELTPRRRAILHASRVEGKSLRVIAEEIGISQRMVEIELKDALAQRALRLNRKIVRRFGLRFPPSSGGTGSTKMAQHSKEAHERIEREALDWFVRLRPARQRPKICERANHDANRDPAHAGV